MNFRISAVVGILLATCVLWMWSGAAPADDAVPTTAKIAVCNPLEVFKDCMEGKDDAARWQQEGDTLKTQASAMDSSLKSEAESLSVMNKTSDDYAKAVEKLTVDELSGQAKIKSDQVNLVREQRQEEVALIQKIFKKIGDVAGAQNINVVLNSAHPDFPADLTNMEDNSFLQTIVMHQVLFSGPTAMDITTQVTISMDKDYSGSNGAGSGGH